MYVILSAGMETVQCQQENLGLPLYLHAQGGILTKGDRNVFWQYLWYHFYFGGMHQIHLQLQVDQMNGLHGTYLVIN